MTWFIQLKKATPNIFILHYSLWMCSMINPYLTVLDFSKLVSFLIPDTHISKHRFSYRFPSHDCTSVWKWLLWAEGMAQVKWGYKKAWPRGERQQLSVSGGKSVQRELGGRWGGSAQGRFCRAVWGLHQEEHIGSRKDVNMFLRTMEGHGRALS